MQRIDTEIVVIGGGATGSGVARDLAMRGFKTVLVEKSDLAHGTTGRYHGLLHSGGRYVVRDPQAAVECIEENRILRKIMPQCIEDTGGFFVVTPWDDPGYSQRFEEGCKKAGIPVEEISIAQMLREEPHLNPKISRCFRVPDASADSFLAADLNADSARQHGAQILPYHNVARLIVETGESKGQARRRVTGVECFDLVKDEQVLVYADIVVNAGGAWAGKIASTADIPLTIIGGKGVMLAMNHRIVNTVINRCKMPSDGDILVPAHTVSVIGTTDVRITDPDQVSIEPWEVHLCLEEGDKLVPGFKDMRMLRAWAGVRPLYQESAVNDTRDVTRAFVLLDHEPRDGVAGIVTITSGKWTTYRKMAEVTTDLVCKKLGVVRLCRTHIEPLPGAAHGNHALGSRLKRIEQSSAFGSLVCECELATEEDVSRAILEGQARTLDDIRRDVRLGMGPCQGGFCTYRAAGILHRLAAKHDLDRKPEVGSTNVALRDFLQERWKGLLPVLWGQQLRQERLDEMIYLNVLNADHLPGPRASVLAAEMYLASRAAGKQEPPAPRETPSTSPSPLDLRRSLDPDVVVIGGGLAGLVSAWQASKMGLKTRLVTKGWGALHWGAGCIDLLGFYPVDREQPLHSPLEGIRQLMLDNPHHPYSHVGVDIIEAALVEFQTLCAQAGYPLRGKIDRNWLLPSALGTIRPTCLAPETMVAGDLSQRTSMLIVGFSQFMDFYPELIAANLAQQGYPARGITLDLPSLRSQRFVTGRVLAARFESAEFRGEVVEQLKNHLGEVARIGFPAVLGIQGALQIKADLEKQIGLPVFEIPTLPPSIPGIRIHNILLAAIASLGGQVYEGMLAQAAQINGKQVLAVLTEAAARTRRHRATSFILATGGILGGGAVARYDGDVREAVFDLKMTAPDNRLDWFREQFLPAHSHPIYLAGLEVSAGFEPVDSSGDLIFENVSIAGSALGHCDPLRERSLEGIALSSAFAIGKNLKKS